MNGARGVVNYDAGAQDGVHYDNGASSEMKNLDRFEGVCGGNRTRVYIGATEEKI
jgi:hypothetical protein